MGCTQASPEYAAAAAEADRLAEQLPKDHEPLKNASAYATPIRSQFLVLYRKFSIICTSPTGPFIHSVVSSLENLNLVSFQNRPCAQAIDQHAVVARCGCENMPYFPSVCPT